MRTTRAALKGCSAVTLIGPRANAAGEPALSIGRAWYFVACVNLGGFGGLFCMIGKYWKFRVERFDQLVDPYRANAHRESALK
jgi:hypothetical protein